MQTQVITDIAGIVNQYFAVVVTAKWAKNTESSVKTTRMRMITVRMRQSVAIYVTVQLSTKQHLRNF
ncbi:MAG: hypothetical protein ACQEXB_24280 [Bacillota bacterium]